MTTWDDLDTRALAAAGMAGRIVSRRADAISPEVVRWIWKGWLPADRVTLVEGRPKDGKTTLVLDLLAKLTTRSPLPDGTRPDRCYTVGVLSYEDDAADTIVPRLLAAGADRSRVQIIDGVVDPDTTETRPWSLPSDISALREMVKDKGVEVLLIDPLSASTNASTDTHREGDVRRVMAYLAHLARESRLTVMAIRHLRKGASGDPREAGLGSIGFTAAARCSWLVGADPETPDGPRVVAVSSSNLATIPSSLGFELLGDEIHDCAAIRWHGPSGLAAGDLLRAGDDEEERSMLDEACGWLEARLSDGPVCASEAYKNWSAESGSGRTLRRAKEKLGVGNRKEGFGGAAKTWWDPPPHTGQPPAAHDGQYGAGQYGNTPSD